MENLNLVILVNFIFINLCFGQSDKNGDFFELGIRTSKFLNSEFLENSKYENHLSDPNVEIMGLLPSATGRNYAAKIRYGKAIFNKAHLVAELSFTKRNEQVICFCHICDKISEPFTLVNINSFDIGSGIRYQIFNLGKFMFLIEGTGSFLIASNESDSGYFGYSINPLIQYKLGKRLNANIKYGFEQSFGEYKKTERYLEVALNFNIKNKAS